MIHSISIDSMMSPLMPDVSRQSHDISAYDVVANQHKNLLERKMELIDECGYNVVGATEGCNQTVVIDERVSATTARRIEIHQFFLMERAG